MSHPRIARRRHRFMRLRQRASQRASKNAFLEHIKETAKVVETWPEWKRKL